MARKTTSKKSTSKTSRPGEQTKPPHAPQDDADRDRQYPENEKYHDPDDRASGQNPGPASSDKRTSPQENQQFETKPPPWKTAGEVDNDPNTPL